MKYITRWMLTLIAVCTVAQFDSAARAQFFGQGLRHSTVLTIHADGTCAVENQTVMPRAAAVQQALLMDRMQQMQDADGDPAQLAAITQAAKTNTLTDAQLKKKLKGAQGDQMLDQPGGDKEPEITVDKDEVTTTVRSSYSSLRDMLAESGRFLNSFEASFGNMRFEQDTNAHLLVTLTPGAMQKRQIKNLRSMFKMSGLHSEMKFVFPGKVLSSSFPETQTNATWITVDASKDESLDALAKLFDGPATITAELAGLTLKEPLESKALVRRFRPSGEMGDDLPITEGATGFVAEAEGLTTTTTYVFPEATNYVKQTNPFAGGQPGTTVHAKLFAPKGRSFQSVTDVKLLKATDDQGRPVAAGESDEGTEEMSMGFVQPGGRGSEQETGTELQLRLALPAPDAQAIDELSAEVVAVTAGTWKELVLTNVNESTTNEIDLAEVLPGAKLVLSKYSNKNGQFNVQARITGPATVKNLKIEAKKPGADEQGGSNSFDQNSKTKGAETTRTIQVNAYSFGMNGQRSGGTYQLLIRYPQDLRRERVTFKLKGLDLL